MAKKKKPNKQKSPLHPVPPPTRLVRSDFPWMPFICCILFAIGLVAATIYAAPYLPTTNKICVANRDKLAALELRQNHIERTCNNAALEKPQVVQAPKPKNKSQGRDTNGEEMNRWWAQQHPDLVKP